MIESLEIDISRVPYSESLESGPGMMVVPDEVNVSTIELYRRFRDVPAACRSHAGVVAIALTGVLNSPDHVRGSGRRCDRRNFEMNIEIRRFEGPIAGNDPSIALIGMKLGSLESGAYQFAVLKTELHFSELHHPERASSPVASVQRVNFNCF